MTSIERRQPPVEPLPEAPPPDHKNAPESSTERTPDVSPEIERLRVGERGIADRARTTITRWLKARRVPPRWMVALTVALGCTLGTEAVARVELTTPPGIASTDNQGPEHPVHPAAPEDWGALRATLLHDLIPSAARCGVTVKWMSGVTIESDTRTPTPGSDTIAMSIATAVPRAIITSSRQSENEPLSSLRQILIGEGLSEKHNAVVRREFSPELREALLQPLATKTNASAASDRIMSQFTYGLPRHTLRTTASGEQIAWEMRDWKTGESRTGIAADSDALVNTVAAILTDTPVEVAAPEVANETAVDEQPSVEFHPTAVLTPTERAALDAALAEGDLRIDFRPRTGTVSGLFEATSSLRINKEFVRATNYRPLRFRAPIEMVSLEVKGRGAAFAFTRLPLAPDANNARESTLPVAETVEALPRYAISPIASYIRTVDFSPFATGGPDNAYRYYTTLRELPDRFRPNLDAVASGAASAEAFLGAKPGTFVREIVILNDIERNAHYNHVQNRTGISIYDEYLHGTSNSRQYKVVGAHETFHAIDHALRISQTPTFVVLFQAAQKRGTSEDVQTFAESQWISRGRSTAGHPEDNEREYLASLLNSILAEEWEAGLIDATTSFHRLYGMSVDVLDRILAARGISAETPIRRRIDKIRSMLREQFHARWPILPLDLGEGESKASATTSQPSP